MKSENMLALWSSNKLAMLATQLLLRVVEVSPSMAFLVFFLDFDIMPVYINLVAFTVLL